MPPAKWPYYAASGAGLIFARHLFLPGRIVSVAESQLGNRYHEKYGIATNWCAVFAGWVIEHAGHSLGFGTPSWRYENGKPVAGAKRLVVRAAEAGIWIAKNGVLFRNPKPGDLISYDRGVEGSWQGHVAIVTGYHDGILDDISGNSLSMVRRSSAKLSSRRLEAIARPRLPDPLMKVGLTAGISYGVYHYLLR